MKIDKWMLLLPVILGLVLILPMISAATTMSAPVAGGNYTKSLAVAITVDPNGANNMTNVTCYYNSSGGAATTQFLQILNTTASQTSFTGTGTLTTETRTYNISCNVYNGTTLNKTLSVASVTIDGTNPTVSLERDLSMITTRATSTIDWSASDSGSTLSSVVTTVTSPDTTRCPTQTYTDTSSTATYLTGDLTKCSGEYTVTILATDYSGNTGTSTVTFKAYDAGLTKTGGNTLGGQVQSSFSNGNEMNSQGGIKPLSDTGKNVALVILVIVIIYFFFVKKK